MRIMLRIHNPSDQIPQRILDIYDRYCSFASQIRGGVPAMEVLSLLCVLDQTEGRLAELEDRVAELEGRVTKTESTSVGRRTKTGAKSK